MIFLVLFLSILLPILFENKFLHWVCNNIVRFIFGFAFVLFFFLLLAIFLSFVAS